MLTKSTQSRTAQKILRRVNGLVDALRADEVPLLAIPAIWDSGKEDHSVPCEVIVTNQRLLGFYFSTFPRRRRFLEDASLSTISAVTLRHKAFEPLFRELSVQEDQRKIYIRATRRYIEELLAVLRSAIEQYVPLTRPTFSDEEAPGPAPGAPIYGRQEIRAPFESSPLAITLLLAGGLFLAVIGFILLTAAQSPQAGLPLFVAGLVAVCTSMLVRRKRGQAGE
jgi:hypothetical protein